MISDLLIVIKNSIDSMGNSKNGAVFELLPDGRLNQRVRLKVYGCCGLVQDQDLGLTQQGTGQA